MEVGDRIRIRRYSIESIPLRLKGKYLLSIGHKTKRMLRDEPENNGTNYDIES